MGPMRRMFLLLFPLLAWLASCSPAWNWREIRLEGAPLTIVLPCKPDHASQTVTLAGHSVPLSMTGCETGGATLAVSRMPLPVGVSPSAALAQWRAATLAGMRAQAVSEQPAPGMTYTILKHGGVAIAGAMRFLNLWST